MDFMSLLPRYAATVINFESSKARESAWRLFYLLDTVSALIDITVSALIDICHVLPATSPRQQQVHVLKHSFVLSGSSLSTVHRLLFPMQATK